MMSNIIKPPFEISQEGITFIAPGKRKTCGNLVVKLVVICFLLVDLTIR